MRPRARARERERERERERKRERWRGEDALHCLIIYSNYIAFLHCPISIYLYIYIYIERERERETGNYIYPPAPLERVPPGCEGAVQSALSFMLKF